MPIARMRCRMEILVQKAKICTKMLYNNTHNMRTVSCTGLRPIIIVHSARKPLLVNA